MELIFVLAAQQFSWKDPKEYLLHISRDQKKKDHDDRSNALTAIGIMHFNKAGKADKRQCLPPLPVRPA
jgi:hypothetical protein